MENFNINNEYNYCDIGDKVKLVGNVKGKNNNIIIKNAHSTCSIDLVVHGNNNSIFIDVAGKIGSLVIRVGNHIPAHNVKFTIDRGFSNEGGGIIYLYNSGNILEIGNNCMFSKNITIRCGDSPHLLFDKNSGEYLDISQGVFIGDHVWVGEDVYITKNVTIPSECIVGAKSIVTKRFEEKYCAIAGNPAKVVRKNVEWVRNNTQLVDGSEYKKSFDLHQNKFN